MKEYNIEQEVYYYHVGSGVVISRTQLKEYKDKGNFSLSVHTPISYALFDNGPLISYPTYRNKTWKFDINEIPFSDEWEVFVRQPNTLTERDMHYLINCVNASTLASEKTHKAKYKLVEELNRMYRRQQKHNVDIPNF